ncbi:MAG: right-handed parallel beta-helix repeat-containing protein [Bacteroidota bacterium]
MRKLLLLIAAFMLSVSVNGQTAGSYSFSYSSGTYTPITGGTQLVASGQDELVSGLTAIGFNFVYCGVTYTNFKASSNGFVYLGGAQTATLSTNDLASQSNLLVLAPFWDDLATDATGNISYYLSTGSPRVLTIEFKNIKWYYSVSNLVNFQVKLYESTNVVEFVYGSMANAPGGSASASIGITDAVGGTNHFVSVTPATTPTSSTTVAFNSIVSSHIAYLPSGMTYTFTPPVSLCGTKTIKSTGGDYANFTAAINDLNLKGVCSTGVTFLVDPGFTVTEICPAITTSGTATGPIIFKKNGSGINPKITAVNPGVGSTDAIVTIKGADYITFDGIDLAENALNTTATTEMEFGYYIINASATDGAQYNTIKNCTITLSRVNTSATVGPICQNVATTPTASTGANSYNKYLNFVIGKSPQGITLIGNSSFPDDGCEVGALAGKSYIGIGTTDSIANTASYDAWGIKATSEKNFKIYNTEVRNVSSKGTTNNVDGIYISNSGSGTTSVGTIEIYNNIIHDLTNFSATSGSAHRVAGMRVNLTGATGSISKVYNNFIYNINNTSLYATGRQIIGIYIQDGGNGSNAEHNIAYNTVSIAPSNLTPNSSCFEIGTSSGPVMKVQNNIFSNTTAASTGKHYCWVTTSTTLIGATGSISNYNDLWVSGTNGFIGLASSTDKASLANWQGLTSAPDAASKNVDPTFISATDLHIQTSNATINGSATPLTAITTKDIDGDTRNAATPDIGADEYFLNGTDLAITAIDRVICSGSVPVLATISNGGNTTITAATINWTVMPGGVQTPYNWSGTLAPGSSVQVSLGNFNFLAATSYSITATIASVTPSPDIYAANDTKTESAIFARLSGTYTVGTGGSYTTIGAVATALNTYGVCGPVSFMITTTYSGGETFPVTFNAITGSSSINTVTIKPVAGASPSISGSYGGALIDLNGAQNIIIDGSNAVGGTTKDLTISNTSTSGYAVKFTNNGSSDMVKNCLLKGANTTYGPVYFSSTTTTGNNNDTIRNCDITYAGSGYPYTGVYFSGSSVSPGVNNTVEDCNITNFSYSGVLIGGYYTRTTIRRCSIYEINAQTSTTLIGISAAGSLSGARNEISRNKIYNINTTGSTPSVYAIYFPTASTDTLNIINNFISLDAVTTTTGATLRGIFNNSNSSARMNVIYNSIYIGGTGSSSTSSCFYLGGSFPSFVRNNIFYNARVPSSGRSYCIYVGSGTLSSLTSNYNDLIATDPISGTVGYNGSAYVVDLVSWQGSGTAKDTNSVSVNPSFTDVTTANLHASAGGLYRKAYWYPTYSSIDYDGAARPVNPTQPCIGADEFVPANDDAGITAINRSYCAGSQSVSVSLKNFGISNLNSVKIDWSVNGIPQTPQNTWSGPALTPGSTTSVTLTPNFNFVRGTNYSITATTSLPNGNTDANSSNDSKTEAGIRSQLSGTYAVGPGGDFTTLRAACDSLNLNGVCGPVSFILNSSYAGSSETYPITINQAAGMSAVNTLTIKPGTGVTASLSGSYAGALIKLNGADYVTIDGSNAVGGSTRDLTISNTSVATGTAAVWMSSLGTAAGATYNTIKNCNISAGTMGTSSVLTYGVILCGSAITTPTNGDDNDYNTIQNNIIANAYYGIYAGATSASGADNRLRILNNTIGSATTTASIGFTGVYLSYVDGGSLSGNTILNVLYPSNTCYGINLNTGVINYFVAANKIHDVMYTGTGGYGGRGIYLNSGNATSNDTIVNNMIYTIGGDGFTGFSSSSPVGIYLDGSSGAIKVWYNSVYMSGTLTTNSVTLTAAMLVYSSSLTALDIKNNVFRNSMNNGANAGAKNYAIYSSAAKTAFTTINNNDYYVSGTQGILGYLAGDITTIAAWRTATSQDVASANSDPQFVSTTDLHASAYALNGGAIPITGITTDIEGDLRNVTLPDIGADEFTPPNDDAGITAIGTTYCVGSQTVTATMMNFGLVDLSNDSIYWSVNSVNQPAIKWTGTVAPGSTTSVNLGTYNFSFGATYSVTAYTRKPNGNTDANPANDSKTQAGIKPSLSGTLTVGTGGSFKTLYAADSTLKLVGLCGPLTLQMLSTYPGGTEVLPLTFNSIAGVSATNTITIKPAPGASPTISSTTAAKVFNFNASQYIIIDGSNTTGGTTKNLTISNSYSSGTAITFTNGSSNNIIKNTVIKGAGSGSSYPVINLSTSTTVGNSNDTIRNCDVTSVGTSMYNGISLNGSSGYVGINNCVEGCNIFNFSNYGIYLFNYYNYTTIRGNIIYEVNTMTGSLYGIFLNYAGTVTNISGNKIYDLKSSGSSPTISAIYCNWGNSGDILNVDNNFISLETSSANASATVTGMHYYPSNAGTFNFFYNSVYIGGNVPAGTTSSSCFKLMGTYPSVVRNNILFNARTSAGKNYCFFVNSTSYMAYLKSNYNDILVTGTGGTIGYDGTTNYTDTTAWKAANKDTASVSINPSFSNVALCDLHASSAGIWKKGTWLAVTKDYDGQARPTNPTRPCIGADEFTPTGDDAGILAINRIYCSGSQTVTATMANYGLSTLVSDSVYWSVNNHVQPPIQWTGSISVGASLSVPLGNYTFATDTAYTITVYTRNPNGNADGNPANDSRTESAIYTQMTGNFNIGATGGNYTTIGAALADLNTRGMCGAVNFVLNNTYNSTSETFPIVINQISGISALNTLTIKPGTGVTASISGSYAGGLIKLVGADYVTIDGSNNGTSSRNLTITNTHTVNSIAAINIQSLGTGAGATHNTIKNCNISTGTTGSSSVYTYGIYLGGNGIGSSGDDNDYNTIQGNRISKAYYGVYANASSTGTNTNLNILNNAIGSATSGNYIGFAGIYEYYADGGIISGDTIYNITNTTGTPKGIILSTGAVSTAVSKNYIHDIYGTSSSGYGGFGIYVASGSLTSNITISNNMIAAIGGTGFSTFGGSSPVGIYLDGSSAALGGVNVWYNSVSMTGTLTYSSSATLTAAMLVDGASNSTIDLRNNIFTNSMVNSSQSSSKNYAIYSVSPKTAFTNINYNDYYVSGTQGVLGYLGGDQTTIAAWKLATSSDLNSINNDPQFTSTTDLHASAFALNGGANVIGTITTDYDGDLRNLTTPDIGADEFTPPNDDAGITAINRAYCSGSQPVNVTLKNFGMLTLTSAKINWTVNGSAQTQYSWSGTLPSGTSVVVPIGSYTFASGLNYNIKAFTTLPNGTTDANPINDSLTEKNIKTTMGGTYSIGTGGDFTSLRTACDSLNARGVCGPVILELNAAYLSSAETFPITINQAPGMSAVNTLTIRPASGVTASISGTYSTAHLIKINGGAYVTIDGSNNGTNSRNLTISNTSTTSSTGAIWVYSAGTGAGSKFITIKNCNLKAGSNANTTYVVFVGSTLGSTGADNDNLTIQNNVISKGYYGIWCGAPSSGVNDNLTISGNIIGSATAADYITNRGIYIAGANAMNISGNEIYNMITSAVSNNIAGIEIMDYVTNGVISKNKIHDIKNNSSSGYGAYGINVGATTGTSGVQMDNNMIYQILTTNNYASSTTWNPFGIRLTGGTGYKLYYNSVNLSGSQYALGSSGTLSAALLITSSTITGNDIRDNIFANGIIGLSGSKSYAIYCPSGTTFSKINYNDYYGNGTYGVLGYLGADKTTLNDWQTATTKDSVSKAIDPVFYSSTDLHVLSLGLDGAGTPIPGITTDIEGDLRNVSIPDIGADEFTFPQYDAGITAINRNYCSGSQNVTVTIKNFGIANLTSATINWSVNSVPQTPLNWSGTTLTTGQSAQVVVGTFSFINGISDTIKATSSLPSGQPDGFTTNDSWTESNIQASYAGLLTVGQGGLFPTLRVADSTLQLYGICGPVKLELQSIYPATGRTEKFPITLSGIAGVSSTNTITIKPASGASPLISGSSSGQLIDFSGTKYVIIDGSNATGGTTKDLTISNTNTSGRALRFIGDGSYNMVKNTVLKGVASSTSVVIFSENSNGAANYDTLRNCDITSGASLTSKGIYFSGASAFVGINNTIEDCNIYNFSSIGIDLGNYYSKTTIRRNFIYQTTAQASSSLYGINVGNSISGARYEISRNKIYNLSSSTSAASIRGIYFSSSSSDTLNVTNNFIDLDGASTSPSASLYGMYNSASSSSKLNFIYNSVYLGGSSSGTTSCFYLSGYSNSFVRNNVLFNARTASSGKSLCFQLSSSSYMSNLTSNYNNLLATDPISGCIGYNTSVYFVDTTAWKGQGKDSLSTSVNPIFTNVSLGDLHSNAFGLWKKGNWYAAYTTDYDGQTRPVSPTRPCIGADEFMPPQNDAGISAISRSYCTGAQPVQVMLYNYGLQTLTSAVINWNVTPGGAQPTYNWSGTLATGASVQVNVGSINFSSGIPYSITAVTSLPNGVTDQNTFNDSKTENNVYTSFSGVITIGPTGTFPTLKMAADTLKKYGVCGATTLSIQSTYTSESTFPITFNAIPGASAFNYITIKPATGATPTITGSNSTALIDLNGINYLTIDGSNTVGGTSRDLTISNTTTTSPGAGIRIINDASNDFVKNTLIKASGSTSYGVYFSTAGVSGNSNNTVYNCAITSSSTTYTGYGVYMYGSSGINSANNKIEKCAIYDFAQYGIDVEYYYPGTIITGNQVYEVATMTTTSLYGIYLNYGTTTTTITNNKVFDLKSTGSNVYGLDYFGGGAGEVATFSNNFVSISNSTGAANVYGFYAWPNNGTVTNFFNNSIYIAGTANGTGTSNCVYQYADYTANYKNNILVNARSNSGAGKNYSINIRSTYANLTSDFNDLLASGTGGAVGYNGVALTSLANWQSAMSKDASSVSVNPNFTNTAICDLHVCASQLFQTGTTISGITTDIDNDPRNSPPCIGADEFTGSVVPTSITATANPICPGSSTTLGISGGSLGQGATWKWYTASCGGTAAGSGTSITVSPSTATSYFVRSEGCSGNTLCATLNVTIKTLSVIATSATATPATICSGDSTLLALTGGSTGTGANWNWYSGSCGGTLVGTGASIKVAPTTATTYYVRAEGDCNTTLCVSTPVAVNICGESWTGAVGTSWGDPGNWSMSAVPTAATDVIIPNLTNKPVITGAAVCKNLTINSGATVTINPGYSLTANGPTFLNGAQCLILKASTTGTGSFIDNGTISGSGTAKIERYVTANDWHYISSPIGTATAALFNGSYLKKWLEATYAWLNITSPSTALTVTTGYTLKTLTNKTIAFIGKPNTGTYVIPVTRNTTQVTSKRGWNLVGNPYPSTINWDAPGMIKNHVDNAIYIYNQTYANYATYVNGFGVNGGSGFITPEQGFFVTCANPFTTGTLTMSNSVRTHKDTTFFKSNPVDYIRLKVHEGTFTDEIIVRYAATATDLFDSDYDGIKIIGGGTQLWSSTAADTSLSYSINALNSIQATPDVPLSFRAGSAGTFTITAQDFNSFDPSVSIVLEDLKTNTSTDIRENSLYQFTADPSDDLNRFILHFNKCMNAPATPAVIQSGSDLISDATAGNQWYEQSGIIAGATNQVFTPTHNGTYYVVVNNQGCTSAPSNQIQFSVTGINENPLALHIELTPNPNNGNFRISSSVSVDCEVTVEIYSVLGEKVLSEKLAGLSSRQFNLEGLGNGIYYLKVKTASEQSVIKFIVNK